MRVSAELGLLLEHADLLRAIQSHGSSEQRNKMTSSLCQNVVVLFNQEA